VQIRSITVVEHSLGRVNLIHGGLDYSVKFQAHLYAPPRTGVSRTCRIAIQDWSSRRSGAHEELPRDLHLGDASFEDIKDGQEVEFEVKGSRFQQGDDSIVVLGHLKQVVSAQKAEAERV
jgi:hypothetical protein